MSNPNLPPQLSERPNFIFLLVDNLRYDSFADVQKTKALYPNIASIIAEGTCHKIIANGHVTKFAMPSVFSQSYPLDYQGYNWGMLYRPRSFVEDLQEAGYETLMCQGDDNDGPLNQYERGFNRVESIYDQRVLLQNFIVEVLNYEIQKWQNGRYSDEKISEILNQTLYKILEYLAASETRVKRLGMPRLLGKVSPSMKRKIKQELELLKNEPLKVLKKLTALEAHFYFWTIGRPDILGVRMFWVRNCHRVFGKLQEILSKKTPFPFRFITSRWSPLASELLRTIRNRDFQNSEPWFAYAHLMDLHDRLLINRPLSLMRKWSKYFIWRKHARNSIALNNSFYDLTLMAVDQEVGRLIIALKNAGVYNRTVFVITGDHGCEMLDTLARGESEEFGFRCHAEHITVPLVMGPNIPNPSQEGLHDTMSVSASILDIVSIDPHPAFLGKSIFAPGRNAVVTENAGRGNADLLEKDLYFTITSKAHKLMARLQGSDLKAERLYNLNEDPAELNNIIHQEATRPVTDDLMAFLLDQRQSLLELRSVQGWKVLAA